MDKNLLLAVSLSLAVYALWFGFVEKRLAPAGPSAPSLSAPTARQAQTPAAAARPAQNPAPTPTPSLNAPIAVDRETLLRESDSLDLGRTQVRLHPRGAAIVSCLYQEPLGTVELVEDPNPGFLATFPELSFKRRPGGSGAAYAARRPDGLEIIKEFIPEAAGSLPLLRLTAVNPTGRGLETGPWTLSLGPGLGTIATEKKENSGVWRALGLTLGEKGLKGKIDSFKPGVHAGDYRWVGVDNRYFLAAVLPSFEDFGPVESLMPPQVTLTAKSAALAPGQSRSWDIPYYIGAKGHTWLSGYKAGLERSIDFGFFAQLGRFVLKVLNRLHEMTGNWGWSIIILTVLLQIALFPLTYKSLKSMAAMKRLQPEIAKLQQKYAKEPSKLNSEMMELYKKSGANPLGGCLPMLLQMPVFLALFNALRNAWELHGAPWIFWITDLSAKDPFYVLPIVMGALMFVQNKMNPAATDPAQAQVMTWMPVIFTFMFLNFPSGLVLYWLTNSVLSTVQQLALKSHFDRV